MGVIGGVLRSNHWRDHGWKSHCNASDYECGCPVCIFDGNHWSVAGYGCVGVLSPRSTPPLGGISKQILLCGWYSIQSVFISLVFGRLDSKSLSLSISIVDELCF